MLDRYALIRRDQVDIIRLILLTGYRSGAAYRLRWKEVRRDRLNLANTEVDGWSSNMTNDQDSCLASIMSAAQKTVSPYAFLKKAGTTTMRKADR